MYFGVTMTRFISFSYCLMLSDELSSRQYLRCCNWSKLLVKILLMQCHSYKRMSFSIMIKVIQPIRLLWHYCEYFLFTDIDFHLFLPVLFYYFEVLHNNASPCASLQKEKNQIIIIACLVWLLFSLLLIAHWWIIINFYYLLDSHQDSIWDVATGLDRLFM